MKKQLSQSRLLFNEDTMNIHLIIGDASSEKWVTITYDNDLWTTFVKEFTGEQMLSICKSLKRKYSLNAVRFAKKAFSMKLRDAKDLIDNLAK